MDDTSARFKNSEYLQELTIPKIQEQLKNGGNSTVMCYGQTSSGKTYNLNLLFPVIVQTIFNYINAESNDNTDVNFTVELSYLQIYNGNVYNLLGKSTKKSRTFSELGELLPKPMGFSMPNPYILVTDMAEVMSHWYDGQKIRATNAHALNQKSSRSHCLLSLTVIKSLNGATLQRSKVTLVDLAGSERLKRTGSTSEQVINEAIHINKSLSSLRRLIEALSEDTPNLPCRDNILSLYLCQNLVDACNILIACVSMETENYNETKNTLEFATIAKKCVVTRANSLMRINKLGNNKTKASKELQQEIVALRIKLDELQGALRVEQQQNVILKKDLDVFYENNSKSFLTNTPESLQNGTVVESGTFNSVISQNPKAETQIRADNRLKKLERQITSFSKLLKDREQEAIVLEKAQGTNQYDVDEQERNEQIEKVIDLLNTAINNPENCNANELYGCANEILDVILWCKERYNESQQQIQQYECNLLASQKICICI